MTPEAIARESARLNAQLVDLVRQLAALAGLPDPADQLAGLKTNPRRPAESMLVERRVLVAALGEIVPRLSQTPVSAPASSDLSCAAAQDNPEPVATSEPASEPEPESDAAPTLAPDAPTLLGAALPPPVAPSRATRRKAGD